LRLLVLGGTLFLGRHVVEAALARGDDVTLFNRGRTNPGLFPDVEQVRGDRDGGLDALRRGRWDAVVDPSGYVPRVVRASAELLAGAAGHYIFVSSISAYRDFAAPRIGEDYPVAELPEESEDVERFYGPLKAGAEEAVRSAFGERAAVIRAGLVVGPYDWTNRFGWWIARVERGGDVLVPDAPHWQVQVIDGRDLASWLLDLAERGVGGTFNATGEPLPMGRLLDEAKSVSSSDARFVPVDEGWLLDEGVEPFDELPLWPALSRRPDLSGFFAVDVSRARAAGLASRPLAETIAATLAWEGAGVEKDYGPAALARGLDPVRERELLAAWATLKS
jgi:2'-hydroxyisoflavone reductase